MASNVPLLAAFVRRDWATARSYRFAFWLQAIYSLLDLALFYFLSKIVDGTSVASDAGTSGGYFAFVLVGLMVMQLMTVGIRSLAVNLRRDQMTGTLEALLVTPAPQRLVLVGSAAFDFVRALGEGLLMLLLGVVVFGVQLTLEPSSLAILALALPATIAVFAGLGVAVAAATIVFKKTDVLLSFVITALALFSGVYFPVTVLPGALEAIAKASPLTWALDAFRAALLGGNVAAYELVLLAVVGVIVMPLAFVLFRAALDYARRAGSLAQF